MPPSGTKTLMALRRRRNFAGVRVTISPSALIARAAGADFEIVGFDEAHVIELDMAAAAEQKSGDDHAPDALEFKAVELQLAIVDAGILGDNIAAAVIAAIADRHLKRARALPPPHS